MKPIFVFAILACLTGSLHAQKTVEVGGAMMYTTKNIVENALNSKDHTILVAALKSADLVAVLESDGPFTVFAPVNKAFDNLPQGTVDNLLKPENKKTLQNILTYHVVNGKWSSADLKKMIMEQKGKATIKTLNGDLVYASLDDKENVWIWDENGGRAMVTISDVYQKNGVIHVIDQVLLPESKQGH